MDDPLHLGTTKTLLIVYHSVTRGTRQMVEAAARGAALEPAVRVRLLPAPLAQAADLLEADGYIFGTPENLAAMAGLMKDFFDRTYYPALDQISAALTQRWSAPAATETTRLVRLSASQPDGGLKPWLIR